MKHANLNGRKFDVVLDWESPTVDRKGEAFIRVFGDGTVILSDGKDQKQTSLEGILEALQEKRSREG